MLFVFSVLAVVVLLWIAFTRRPSRKVWFSSYLPRVGFLFGAGLLAASPFLTDHALGTSEAYNYSLAVADFSTQERAGVFPPLVGQSIYAFNGRIHPLRTAPWLLHLAGALDLAAFHRLNFWAIQNLALSLSILAAVGACYFGLRRATPVSPRVAAILAAAFAFSPGFLSAAYSMDLYMTVAAAPCIPLVICANLRSWGARAFRDYALLAAALALAWLAHPPVAFWLSVATIAFQGAVFLTGRVKWHEWPAILGAVILGGVLVAFAVESALSVKSYGDVTETKDVKLLHHEVSRVFADSLRPVSASADRLSDFQLGYAFWALLLLAAVLGVWQRRVPAVILVLISGFLLALTVPIPGVHTWLWDHLPAISVTLTNQWPMQRLYLLVTVFALFAFALVWRPPPVRHGLLRDVMRLVIFAAIAWTAHEAYRFIGRGFASRSDSDVSVSRQLSENINPTVISYAILGTPGSFVHGVMDPAFEFRLLHAGTAAELATNWSAEPLATGTTGTFTPVDSGNRDILLLTPKLTLEPGLHYLLTFDFLGLESTAVLQIRGRSFFREYVLPSAGNARGFGQRPGNNRSITVWTSSAKPEEIELRLVAPGIADAAPAAFAKFKFRPIDPTRLPIQLERLVPELRARVNAPADSFLETPRLFIDGYTASVDGKPVRVQRSLDGLAMVPVAVGEHHIVLSYVGPTKLRAAFWLSLSSWFGFAIWSASSWLIRRRPDSVLALPFLRAQAGLARGARIAFSAIIRWLAPRKMAVGLAALGMVTLGVGGARWLAWRDACGPIRIRLVLPRGETNRSQPILVTGKPHAGTFIYVVYLDEHHVRLGVDVWGQLGYETPAIPVDYFGDQEILISTGALYPEGHPRLSGLGPAQLEKLRRRIYVTLNGQVVIDQMLKSPDYPSTRAELSVGKNLIGGSHAEPQFFGKILRVERVAPGAEIP